MRGVISRLLRSPQRQRINLFTTILHPGAAYSDELDTHSVENVLEKGLREHGAEARRQLQRTVLEVERQLPGCSPSLLVPAVLCYPRLARL